MTSSLLTGLKLFKHLFIFVVFKSLHDVYFSSRENVSVIF